MMKQELLKDNPDMPISISLNKHNASSLDYIFRAWVKKEDYLDAMFACNANVKKYFDQNNIEIPYNKLDLYMKKNLFATLSIIMYNLILW